MPKQAEVMGPLQVKNLSIKATDKRPADKPGLYFVGEVPGLAIQLLPTGAKTWILRVKIGEKRRDMGLGGYPEISLADARTLARQARQKVREGIDPIDERRAARSARLASAASVMTFKAAAEAFIKSKEAEWKNAKHRKQWSATLEKYAYPTLGKLSVADIDDPHIMNVLEPIWTEKTETASRLRGRMELVLNWATAKKVRTGLNPARWRGHLENMLPQPGKVKARRNEQLGQDGHHPALSFDQAPAFMAKLRCAEGMGAKALEFAILTATRSGEVRGATWNEIDLQAGVWTIPANRMKAGREHRVPLSIAAKEILEALPRIAGTNLVFPAARGGQLSDMTLTAVIRRMKMDVAVTVHGFRSTFRDWAGETTAYPREVIEHALAHLLPDKAEAAYARGTLLQKRAELMESWSQFLLPVQSENVVPLRGRV